MSGVLYHAHQGIEIGKVMSQKRTTASFTLDSPAATISALPDLIGFTPQESLVIIYLNGQRVIVTARSDIDSRWHLSASDVASTGTRVGADGAIVIVCDARGGSPELPWLAEITDCSKACEQSGIQVRASLLVDGNQYWSYPDASGRTTQAVAHVTAILPTSTVNAQAISKGRSRATTREEFIMLYQRRPAQEPSAAAFEAAVGESTSIALRAEQAWADVCEISCCPSMTPGTELVLARVQLAMQDVRIRDLVLCRVAEAELGQELLVDAVVHVALSSPDQLRPRLAGAAAALLAAIQGNSIAAECLIDLAAGDSLAELTAASVRALVPPSALRAVLVAAKPEVLAQLISANQVEDSAS